MKVILYMHNFIFKRMVILHPYGSGILGCSGN